MPKTIEELETELSAANTELATAKDRIKELNGESGAHRGNYNREKKAREDAEAARDAAFAERDAATDKHKGELERQRIDLNARATAAEGKAAEAVTRGAERSRQAELRIAARDAGMHDLDGLKLLDAGALKLDDDGNITNASDVLGAMKATKPYLFGTASTSSTYVPPKQGGGAPKHYRDMNPEERRAAATAAGVTNA